MMGVKSSICQRCVAKKYQEYMNRSDIRQNEMADINEKFLSRMASWDRECFFVSSNINDEVIPEDCKYTLEVLIDQ